MRRSRGTGSLRRALAIFNDAMKAGEIRKERIVTPGVFKNELVWPIGTAALLAKWRLKLLRRKNRGIDGNSRIANARNGVGYITIVSRSCRATQLFQRLLGIRLEVRAHFDRNYDLAESRVCFSGATRVRAAGRETP